MSNPLLNIGEDLVFTAVLTEGEGGGALTGKTIRAEVQDISGTVISTGTHSSTESPNGTYIATIPAANLTALVAGRTYVPRYYGTNVAYEARGRKVAGYRPLT